ncbi:MAG: nitroreductase family protein [Spirochaetaceae bacterium]|nr:nitroreductase family protein [Spirochaetaceae bacterium]
MDKRISVRTYSTTVPEGELFERIQRIIKKERKGPFGNRYSMTFMDIDKSSIEDLGKMTSYGMIKNARFYFGGYADGGDRAIIDYGYCFEEVLLELTDLDLGTCWVGGTFGRSFIASLLSLPEGKVIPAISPLGYPHEKRAFVEKLTRMLARSRRRKPLSKILFKQNDEEGLAPVHPEDLQSPLNEIFHAVQHGPSASNKQPWRIVMHNDMFHFYCDYNKTYNALIKGFHIQSLDMGIALCHFTKAAEELRLKGKFSYSDPKYEKVDWIYILSWNIKR